MISRFEVGSLYRIANIPARGRCIGSTTIHFFKVCENGRMPRVGSLPGTAQEQCFPAEKPTLQGKSK
jgi:hypothetical protein